MHPRFGHQDWITPYGVALLAALAVCWLSARRRCIALRIEPSHVDLALPVTFILAAITAKLLSFAATGDNDLAGALFSTPYRFRVFAILAIAVPLLAIYARLADLRVASFLDLFALPFLLWLAMVRVGCFLAGCCWGDVAVAAPGLARIAQPAIASQVQTVPALTGDWVVTALRFPAGSYAFEQQRVLGLVAPESAGSLPVHPTQLYELVALLAAWTLLRRYERDRPEPGSVALATLALYCAIRFPIEYLRADSTLLVANLTFTQLCCLVAGAAAVALLIRNRLLGIPVPPA